MLKRLAQRIRMFLVGDILRELATVKAKLEVMEQFPALAKNIEAALLTLAIYNEDHKPSE
ncbi:MAG: hypothetical protein P4L54_05820 [Acidocella sp.]|nr:hypothetical protein [Acidocella sp.]